MLSKTKKDLGSCCCWSWSASVPIFLGNKRALWHKYLFHPCFIYWFSISSFLCTIHLYWANWMLRLYQGKPESKRQTYKLWDYLILSCYQGRFFFFKECFPNRPGTSRLSGWVSTFLQGDVNPLCSVCFTFYFAEHIAGMQGDCCHMALDSCFMGEFCSSLVGKLYVCF